jgi:hypothetical protein
MQAAACIGFTGDAAGLSRDPLAAKGPRAGPLDPGTQGGRYFRATHWSFHPSAYLGRWTVGSPSMKRGPLWGSPANFWLVPYFDVIAGSRIVLTPSCTGW